MLGNLICMWYKDIFRKDELECNATGKKERDQEAIVIV